jgi:hypothetical protein
MLLIRVGNHTRDVHCVTSRSKLDTQWEGVTVDDILADAGLSAPTSFVLAHCFDGYSTNVPLADLTWGKAMVALKYQGEALPRDHGGRATPGYVFICGSNDFVDVAADGALGAGLEATSISTERYGV